MRARQALSGLFVLGMAATAAGCDDFKTTNHQSAASAPSTPAAPGAASTPAAPAPAIDTAQAATPAVAPAVTSAATPSSNPAAQAIEAASLSASAPGRGSSSLLIKAEVLLDRSHFSPGVIDGRGGGNLTNALTAYRKARGLSGSGPLDAETLTALTAADKAPITQDYVITADDEAGPFIGKPPTTFADLAKLKSLGYADPVQALSARFHMTETLLKTLNPTADFSAAGTTILVVRPASTPLPPVARLEVDKAANQVRALDAAGQMVAAFPATVGSTERPAPVGEWAVKAVAPHPNYTYDPSKLTFGPRAGGVLTIAPGPNNPVGSTWIALTKETYGIHGSPDPNLIGKTASHGCVRLTNWDAETLGKAVSKGMPVVFVGETSKHGAKA